jgi:PAS domain S-box-containing protein
MEPALDRLLEAHHAGLKKAWAERMRQGSRLYAARPPEETDRSVSHALNAVTACIAGRGTAEIAAYTSHLARLRLEHGIPQVETVGAFLAGRDLVLDLIHENLPPERYLEATHQVDDAFHRVIASYGSAFCSLCTARQDERRHHLQRHLESLVERSQDAMILFDEDRKIRAWNAGAEALLGYASVDVLGKTLDLVVPRDRRAEFASVWPALQSRDHVRLSQTRAQRQDGTSVWIDAAWTTVRVDGGTTLGTWAVFRDITAGKTLEEEKLQSERLALIGTMSAKLAHEVRNPLNSLVLGLDLVRDDLNEITPNGGAKAREALDLLSSVEDELHRIRRTVEDYLRFARLPRVQLEPVVIDPLLRDRLELMRQDFQQSKITLDLDLRSGDAHVHADPAQLWQAVLNLVRNAIEAMPSGGTLRVATSATADRVECVIEDTGTGMTAEARSQLFRPFFSTKSGGTGLGMALARQILHEHGAAIECESEVGEGTRFTLSFPRARQAAAG